MCDDCGYEKPVEAITPHLLGAWCPVCLKDLFTQRDWEAYQRSLIFAWIASWFPAGRKAWKRVAIRDGKIETQ